LMASVLCVDRPLVRRVRKVARGAMDGIWLSAGGRVGRGGKSMGSGSFVFVIQTIAELCVLKPR
jgi:hypothetical protein